ncbi:hypothetical protein C6I21_04995 [Alkalicoccus urumqiensis]|uniref:Uncharacterized protein n=1 Tax=Alkalicoccus urumqiensis TaxID=1548213 RepID=A0A2P6MIR5_ALKUR|nr:hypothetical protein C6I21_04995 [Alkalicoccus urumqiensis]
MSSSRSLFARLQRPLARGSFTPAEESKEQLSSAGLPGLVARDQGASAFQIPSGTRTAAGAGRKREPLQ